MDDRPIEESIQAYLDGELSEEDAAELEARMAADPDVRRRHALLKAAKAALEDAAPEAAVLPPEVEARLGQELEAGSGFEAPMTRSRTISIWVAVSLTAAAALFVALLWLEHAGREEREAENPAEVRAQEKTEDEAREPGASNEWLQLQVVKEKRAATLLSDPVFTVQVERIKPIGVLCLLPWKPDETLEDVAERMVTEQIKSAPRNENGFLPVVLGARITTPSGKRLEGRLEFPENPTMVLMNVQGKGISIKARKASWTLPLSKILVKTIEPLPYFAVLPDGEGGWVADPIKAHQRMPGFRNRKTLKEITPRWEPFFPAETGPYRVEFLLHSLPARKEYSWPTFEDALAAGATCRVSGVVGEWSQPVNGIQVRLACPKTSWRKGAVVPVALQIRNVAETPRKYNFYGTTTAKIPQPYHFEFSADDERFAGGNAPAAEFKALSRSGVIFYGDYLLARHPPGTTRTVVVPLNAWSQHGVSLSELLGPHTLRARFHFQPTLWLDEDKEMWMGKIEVPPIEYAVEQNL
jgi:hypothetical protein